MERRVRKLCRAPRCFCRENGSGLLRANPAIDTRTLANTAYQGQRSSPARNDPTAANSITRTPMRLLALPLHPDHLQPNYNETVADRLSQTSRIRAIGPVLLGSVLHLFL